MALTISSLAPTPFYDLTTKLCAPDGVTVERSLHGTIEMFSEK